MRSTFATLETARRALYAQQAALQTTAHNIANANTPGYSRQRVNLTTTAPYPAPGLHNGVSPGQIGTGVQAETVQRVRRDFLDVQYRQENTKYGYWQTRSEALSKMENILNEPSENGLSKAFDRFWQSLQDLANNPENDGARSVVRQRGMALANTFHYLSNSLSQIRADLQKQIDVTVKQVNSLARQINSLNQQISQIEPHGYLANDLYDKRDLLVDQLSELVTVKVTSVGSGGESLAIAEGRYTIDIVDAQGNTYTLVNGRTLNFSELSVSYNGTDGAAQYDIGGISVKDSISGKLQGLKDSYNEVYPDMLRDLDVLAHDFAVAFNSIHEQGYGLDGNSGYQFFQLPVDANGKPKVGGAAKNITVSGDVDKLDHIAASADGTAGDNGNALKLADVITGSVNLNPNLDITVKNFKDYYEGVIGGMAVDAQEAERLADNSLTLKQSAQKRRESVSGVSLDEEMTHIIQFQHAYNAAARMVTVVDEMLNRIINRMGI
ncbi:MAG TPA: flagellar hook-associated protein FlgK [Bacillales bacterium]|nr:flagellar hook-associated protein FlgK [Bacillales bacterium]